MISKEKRDEVWKNNKLYMDPDNIEETAKDLLPFCSNCKEFCGIGKHDFEKCRGKHCIELWLSNEYQEWENAWN